MGDSEQEFADAALALGHELRRDESGAIDWFFQDTEDGDGGGHNGPACVKCGESWCVHCVAAERDVIGPCVPKPELDRIIKITHGAYPTEIRGMRYSDVQVKAAKFTGTGGA